MKTMNKKSRWHLASWFDCIAWPLLAVFGPRGQGDPPEGGDPSPDDDDLIPRAMLRDVIKARDTAKTQRAEAIRQLEELKSQQLSTEELELFKKLKADAEAAEEATRIQKGEYDELLKAAQAKHQQALDTQTQAHDSALAEKDKTISDLNLQIDRLTIDSAIELAAVEAGVSRSTDNGNVDKVAEVTELARKHIRRVPLEDGYEIRCFETPGEDLPMRDKNGDLLKIDDFIIDTFLAQRPHYKDVRIGSGPTLPGSVKGGRDRDPSENNPIDNVLGIYNK